MREKVLKWVCGAAWLGACGGATTGATPDAAVDAAPDTAAPPADAAPDTAVPPADAVPDAPAPGTAAVSGNAFNFAPGGGGVVGGEVSIVEQPERTTVTGDGGVFRFDGVPVGGEVTLRLHFQDYPLIQTGTWLVPPEGLERVTFQAPDPALYETLSRLLRLTPDPGRCQIASTVTRVGNSLYDTVPGTHGEPGATVRLEPSPAEADGPIYFNLTKYNIIWPQRTLPATSADGGVLFLNVTPGEYMLVASKPDTVFRPVKIRCEPGLLVNASPPWLLPQHIKISLS